MLLFSGWTMRMLESSDMDRKGVFHSTCALSGGPDSCFRGFGS